MMKIDGPSTPTVSGGPLNGEYSFAQLHFHWGGNDTVGSERKFDKKSFPLELHMVFYKKEYKDVDSSLNYEDGLTVLACIFEVIGSRIMFLLLYTKRFTSAYQHSQSKI